MALNDLIGQQVAENPTLAITDPGTPGATSDGVLSALNSGVCALTSAGAGETRTLAVPSFLGQSILLVHDTDGGSITVDVASGFNIAADTDLVFTAAGGHAHLIGVTVGGVLRWRLVSVGLTSGNAVQVDPAVNA